jgi:hypothetical protein
MCTVFVVFGTCHYAIEGFCSWKAIISSLPKPSASHQSHHQWTTTESNGLSAQMNDNKTNNDDDDETSHGSTENNPFRSVDTDKEAVDDSIDNTNASTTARLQQLLAETITTANPSVVLQKAVDKYWEDFQKSVGGGNSGTFLSLPSPSQWMQLLYFLVELSTDPTQPSTVEAWGEVQTYESKNTSLWNNKDKNDDDENAVSEVGNKTILVAWRDSWNKSLTNDDVRDMGDHLWRYLIGGE